jgi:hypothetical protein
MRGTVFARYGIVSGVEAAHLMDGGYRGQIRIVPAVPAGPSLKHLAWVASRHSPEAPAAEAVQVRAQ